MALKIIPINMVCAPNAWAPSKDSFWTVTDGVSIDLWGQIVISDALGVRPYIPALGSSLQALFQRGDYIGSINNLHQSVTKPAIINTDFRAMVKFPLSSSESSAITSGTVLFTLTEGSVVNKWSQNWSIKKLNTSAGF